MKSIEAVGLWFARRWAEYLTFVSTLVFIPVEIHELIKSITALKVLAFVINVAIAVYLLYAKRLFGLRGGGKAEHAEREADTGWPAIERSTPHGSTPERSIPHGSTPEIPHGSTPGRSAPRGTPDTRLPACGGPVACGPEPAEVGA